VNAKVYLGTRCCDPHTREILFRAFDRAWEQIARDVSDHPRDIEASRMVIAEIVLRLSENGCRDPSAISREVVAYWG
jgi:hypothetical protein